MRSTQPLLQVQKQFNFIEPALYRTANLLRIAPEQALRAQNALRKAVFVNRAGQGPALNIIPVNQLHNVLCTALVVADNAPVTQIKPQPFWPPAGPAYLLSQMFTGTPLTLP